MNKIIILLLAISIPTVTFCQRIETVYLNKKDSTANMYVAVMPQDGRVNSFMFLLDGFGNYSPKNLMLQTDLPTYAAQQNILTIIPILKTGPLYFGSDSASQQSLKELIELVVAKYKLQGKDFYLGGFSIGGTCVIKYTELAIQNEYPIIPKAVFAVDPPLDWQRYYDSAKRVVRISKPNQVNEEVTYMIDRIQKEMGGTPETALENFYIHSPYSYSDTTQKAIKSLIKMPIMIISEPDIQWWLVNRNYDYSFLNITDQAAMINELRKLGNRNAVLLTTTNKGYRKPNNNRHPHSWSIADPVQTIEWLRSQ
ncbi:MAG: alpha/beta hydrolase [Sphingobacteriaceae bacterium]|jgi:hypothetical protein|nr:alpha/beta hydrolase [Sphingobacteriaceae bacterium]